MDKWGDLIYVLIAVVWFLYSLYAKEKKKQEQQPRKFNPTPQPIEKEEGERKLQDLLDEILLGKEKDEEETEYLEEEKPKPVYRRVINESPQPEAIPVPHKEDAILKKWQEAAAKVYNTKPEVTVQQGILGLSAQEFQQDEEMNEKNKLIVAEEAVVDGIDFDLHKAVLYSEILRRPAYLNSY